MNLNKIKEGPVNLDSGLTVKAALAEIINKETIKENNMNEINCKGNCVCKICGSEEIDALMDFEEIAYRCHDCGYE